jgi:hypothetical protein
MGAEVPTPVRCTPVSSAPYTEPDACLPIQYKQTKQTPWLLVRERTIPTDRPPLVDEI